MHQDRHHRLRVELEEGIVELLARQHVDIMPGPGHALFGQGEAHLGGADRGAVVVEFEHCRPVDFAKRRNIAQPARVLSIIGQTPEPTLGFLPQRRTTSLSVDRAAICARRDDAACARLGRGLGVPGRDLARRRRARLRRYLCEGRCRRLGADAARCRAHFRGTGARLHLDRRLYLHPQHGGVDDRHLWQRSGARKNFCPSSAPWSISPAIA